MIDDDILVKCFNQCVDYKDIYELIKAFGISWSIHYESLEKYYFSSCARTEYVLLVLTETIPDAFEKREYGWVLRRDWERELTPPTNLRELEMIGKEEPIEFRCSDYVDMRYQ